jgi:hypothetical protein
MNTISQFILYAIIQDNAKKWLITSVLRKSTGINERHFTLRPLQSMGALCDAFMLRLSVRHMPIISIYG